MTNASINMYDLANHLEESANIISARGASSK